MTTPAERITAALASLATAVQKLERRLSALEAANRSDDLDGVEIPPELQPAPEPAAKTKRPYHRWPQEQRYRVLQLAQWAKHAGADTTWAAAKEVANVMRRAPRSVYEVLRQAGWPADGRRGPRAGRPAEGSS